MPSGLLSAAEPSPTWGWRPVVVVEVSPRGCSVRLELAEPAELRGRAMLPVPVGDLLREQPPDQLPAQPPASAASRSPTS